jgi:hypothetical protein
MRFAPGGVLLTLFLSACGGDSNDPGEPFPDVEGVYALEGTFDDLSPSEGSFEGTLELTQASQESGALGGSMTILATLGDDIFNVAYEELSDASISPSGTISFTADDGIATWTFSGTASGSSIINGRHTLSDGSQSMSGAWHGDAARPIRSVVGPRESPRELLSRLRTRMR